MHFYYYYWRKDRFFPSVSFYFVLELNGHLYLVVIRSLLCRCCDCVNSLWFRIPKTFRTKSTYFRSNSIDPCQQHLRRRVGDADEKKNKKRKGIYLFKRHSMSSWSSSSSTTIVLLPPQRNAPTTIKIYQDRRQWFNEWIGLRCNKRLKSC